MGSDLRTTPNNTYSDTGMQARTDNGRTFTIIGFVCAAVALFFIPIVFGPAAIILGLVGRSKGDPLGTWAAVAGGVALVVGIVLGMMVFNAAQNANT